MESLRVGIRRKRGRHSEYGEFQIPTDTAMERLAATLHAKHIPALTTCLDWKVLYEPASPLRYSTTEVDPFTGKRGQTFQHQTSTISYCVFGYGSKDWRVCYSWNRGENKLPVRIQEKGDVILLTGQAQGILFHNRARPLTESVGNEPLLEGAVQQVELDEFERSPEARKLCIEHYGAKCCACGFDFGTAYGHVAARFIHVHHLTPLSESCAEHAVDPIRDMRPVCPNCHAVLHMRTPPFGIDEVQAFLDGTRRRPWIGRVIRGPGRGIPRPG